MRILVTGGAGYIGSHVVKLLSREGHELLVYDNLSHGHRRLVVAGELVVGDLLDLPLLEKTLKRFAPEAVVHLAALVSVEESVQEPGQYYEVNFSGTLNLLKALPPSTRYLLFSSTAAVYGEGEKKRYRENAPLRPLTPYAYSKLFAEQAIQDVSRVQGWRFVIFRYFNVAGADPEGEIGPLHEEPTHLMNRAVLAALGELPVLEIYGNDYPTPDGSCLRDYIHVMDIAGAHLQALAYLGEGKASEIFNVGYGKGTSVLELVRKVQEVTGRTFPTRIAPRRPGDPSALIADPGKIRKILKWEPLYDDLEGIIRSLWHWECKRRGMKVTP